jgi:hypothetical protein
LKIENLKCTGAERPVQTCERQISNFRFPISNSWT